MLTIRSAQHENGTHCEYCYVLSVLPVEINFGEGFDAIGSITCEGCLVAALHASALATAESAMHGGRLGLAARIAGIK